MNRADRIRWDRKYSEKVPPGEISPDPFLAASLPGMAKGRALDLACGFGDNAIVMARAGFEVTAVDISSVALERAKGRALKAGVHVDFVLSDVEDFDFGERVYDLISGFYFLNRSVFPKVKRGLRPGGIFLYKTYTLDELHYRPALNRRYLLEKGELKGFFDDSEILLYEEKDNGAECTAKIVARKQGNGPMKDY